jgi:hypothetical protein
MPCSSSQIPSRLLVGDTSFNYPHSSLSSHNTQSHPPQLSHLSIRLATSALGPPICFQTSWASIHLRSGRRRRPRYQRPIDTFGSFAIKRGKYLCCRIGSGRRGLCGLLWLQRDHCRMGFESKSGEPRGSTVNTAQRIKDREPGEKGQGMRGGGITSMIS